MKKLLLSMLFLVSLSTAKTQGCPSTYQLTDHTQCRYAVLYSLFPKEYFIVIIKDTSYFMVNLDTFYLKDRYILPTDIDHFKTAYSWGNHAGLYRPISYVPAWGDVTGKPSFSTVAISGDYNDLSNKPTLFNGAYSSLTGIPSTFAPSAHSHPFSEINSLPTSLAGYGITDPVVLTSGSYSNPSWITGLAYSKLSGAPSLATVATSGLYNDLSGRPSFATVATSGQYSDLSGKPDPVPVGQVSMFGGSSAPTGYLICDGSAVSRTLYASLFSIIGTTYGPGDGSTTFNLPDLRQRFPLGKAASGTGSTLGGAGGTIDPVYSADPPNTVSSVPSANSAAATPVLGSAPTTTHTHSVDISAFNVTGANPPYLVLNYIIKH